MKTRFIHKIRGHKNTHNICPIKKNFVPLHLRIFATQKKEFINIQRYKWRNSYGMIDYKVGFLYFYAIKFKKHQH